MRTVPIFRRKLAHRLRVCAVARRRACAGDPSGEDLKVIALCERLALDAEQLPEALVDEAARLCADPLLARRFKQVWDSLPDVLGVMLVPSSAAHLVRWLIEQTRHDPRPETGMPCSDPTLSPSSQPEPGMARRAGSLDPMRGGHAESVAHDFTGAFAVVSPMLAIWVLATGIGQWRDQAFAASHAAMTATVESVTSDESRSIVPPVTETLAFTPPGEHEACHVAIRFGNRLPDEPGQLLTVVPRSAACEAPLVPGTIGSPLASMLAGLVFLASGAFSFKVWTRLHRRRASAGGSAAPLRAAIRAAL